MNVTHLLLGHPWLYNNAVKHCGRNNTYKFTYEKKTNLSRPTKPFTGICPVTKSSASNTQPNDCKP